MKKKPTIAQRWQRKRFWAKGSIVQTKRLLNSISKNNVFTDLEMTCIEIITQELSFLIRDWEKGNSISKAKFLSKEI